MATFAATLAARELMLRLPAGQWLNALLAPDPQRIDQMLIHYSMLPRIVVAMLSGAALALAGAVMQQVLRNPLAEPTTIGVASGAHLALAAATLWAPFLFAWGREWPAIAGAAIVVFIVFRIAWRHALSPLSLILASLTISFYCGAIGAAIVLFNHDYLTGLFVWGTGFLGQQDWSVAAFLLPRLAIAGAMIGLMWRPITLLGLEDEHARSLGLGLTAARAAALAGAVILTAVTVAAAGMIGFIGLAAPTLARLAGARRIGDRLIWSPLIGAALLWLTDQLVLLIPAGFREVPTGAATAVIGAPLLLLLLPRLGSTAPPSTAASDSLHRLARPWRVIGAGVVALAALIVLALAASSPNGEWNLPHIQDIVSALPWRVPRITAAAAAGALLGLAGVFLQRMTGNPLAAPEVLGVSSGAALGVIIAVFSTTAPTRGMQIAAGAVGAGAVLGLMLALTRRSAFSPDRLLIAGVAASSVFGIIVAVVLASGDPRSAFLLAWMAGSTYQTSAAEATLAASFALAALALLPAFRRWLDILPLGGGAARSLGVSHVPAQRILLAMVAATTAAATIIIGPLSFIGLMAPHMARMAGFQRAIHHAIGAALLGALIMVAADWIGRTVIFPFQLPAGLVATLLGGPYFLWLFRRS